MEGVLVEREEGTIGFVEEPSGSCRVQLTVDDRQVSRCWIVPQTIAVEQASLRMDGIGGVGTEDDCRLRGYSSRVLRAAVGRMEQGDAALTMLYGIPHFYPRFGYATVAPQYGFRFRYPWQVPHMPTGWSVRRFELADMPAVQAIYGAECRRAVGPALRSPDGTVWRRLEKTIGSEIPEAIVAVAPDGTVAGYMWHGTGCWSVDFFEQDHPEQVMIGEAIASTLRAGTALIVGLMDGVIAHTAATGAHYELITVAAPPDTMMARAAKRMDTHFFKKWEASGGSMARVLNVERLLRQLAPELAVRLHTYTIGNPASLRFVTDIGSARLTFEPGRVGVDSEQGGPIIEMPQTALARLALGGYAPDDILDQLPSEPAPEIFDLICALFPRRSQHMYLTDRY